MGEGLFPPVEIGRFASIRRPAWCHGRVTECNPHVLIGDIRLFDASERSSGCPWLQVSGPPGRRLTDTERFGEWLHDVEWRPHRGATPTLCYAADSKAWMPSR